MKIKINQIIMNKDLKDYVFGRRNLETLKDYNLMAGTLQEYYLLNFFQKIWAIYTKRDIYFFDILTRKTKYKVDQIIEVELTPYNINSPYALIKGEK